MSTRSNKRKACTSVIVASQASLTFGPKYPPGPDDSKWSTVPHVKTLNKLTDQAAHAFIAVPGLDMENFKKMRQLNFDNWTDSAVPLAQVVMLAEAAQAAVACSGSAGGRSCSDSDDSA